MSEKAKISIIIHNVMHLAILGANANNIITYRPSYNTTLKPFKL